MSIKKLEEILEAFDNGYTDSHSTIVDEDLRKAIVEIDQIKAQVERFMSLDYTDGNCRDDLRNLQIEIEEKGS